MSEPKDAAAARRIIAGWNRALHYTPAEYVESAQNNPGLNARHRLSPALNIVTQTPPIVPGDVGEGWELLSEGTPLQPGDGFIHPDYPGFWTDYACRPDLFRGGGLVGSWYHVPKRDYAHTWPWRRLKIEQPELAPRAKPVAP